MLDHLSKKQLYFYTTLGAILANILWGTAFPVLKIVYKDMAIASSDVGETITFISIRFFLAGIILLAIAMFKKLNIFEITKKQWRIILILGLFNTTIQYSFFNIGVNNTSGIKAAILGQIGIFFSVLLAHLLYKNDKINAQKAVGLSFGLIGLIVVNLGKSTDGFFSFTLVGEGFMILSGLTSALSMFVAKKIGSQLPTLVYSGWQMVIGSTLLYALGTSSGTTLGDLQFTPLSIMLLIYLALLSSIAFWMWYAILQYRKIGEISLFKFVVPVSGALLTALFIPEEQLLPIHIIGLLFVSIGIIIVNRKPKTNN